MHDQQAPALKPLLLTPKPPSIVPPKSPAALQGAVFAFLPRPATPTVSVASTSVGARIAAFTAGTKAQQRPATRSPERRDGSAASSPSRGRQLPYNANLSLNAAEVTTSLSTSASSSSRPSIKTRSSSTLAAQHASAQSRSPRRSPDGSVQSSNTFVHQTKEDDRNRKSTDALSGATVSMAANPVREQAFVAPALSVKNRALNFEKIPMLPPPPKVDRTANDSALLAQALADERAAVKVRPVSLSPSVVGRSHTYSGTNLAPVRVETSLQIPGQNTTKNTTITLPLASSVENPHGYEGAVVLAPGLRSGPRRGRSPPLKNAYQDLNRDAMTVNDLADAMVASALASSRAASPTKKAPPPPAPRRRSHSIPITYEAELGKTREHRRKPQKPPRAMKLTLRKQGSSDEEMPELAKRGRRHWMRKHPNMHSEGDRKRWRDKISTRERKRYEGVFAANRGLLIGLGFFEPSPDTLSDNLAEGNQVVNIIVRDIWERSRLPREVLKEIYDLVSPEEAHALNREQFVVGLWLIDQRLKGRKLPVKVSASVWSSVRHAEGIKIRSRRYS